MEMEVNQVGGSLKQLNLNKMMANLLLVNNKTVLQKVEGVHHQLILMLFLKI